MSLLSFLCMHVSDKKELDNWRWLLFAFLLPQLDTKEKWLKKKEHTQELSTLVKQLKYLWGLRSLSGEKELQSLPSQLLKLYFRHTQACAWMRSIYWATVIRRVVVAAARIGKMRIAQRDQSSESWTVNNIRSSPNIVNIYIADTHNSLQVQSTVHNYYSGNKQALSRVELELKSPRTVDVSFLEYKTCVCTRLAKKNLISHKVRLRKAGLYLRKSLTTIQCLY